MSYKLYDSLTSATLPEAIGDIGSRHTQEDLSASVISKRLQQYASRWSGAPARWDGALP